MKNTSLKSKILSLLIMLTMLVGMMPYSGIISYAVDSSEVTDAPFEVSAVAKLGEEMTMTVPFKNDGRVFISFTPTVTATYIIKAINSTSDPMSYLYDSQGEYINSSDDYLSRLFRIEHELEAGNTYYIGLCDYSNEAECTFVVFKECDTHTPTEDVNCLGILCDVCGMRFGEGNDNHYLTDQQICIGYYCYDCCEYFGEGSEDGHVFGEYECNDNFCYVCEQTIGESTADHIDDERNFRCDYCDELVLSYDITLSGATKINISVYDSTGIVIKFVPEETATYRFYSSVDGDPIAKFYDEKGDEFLYVDDSSLGNDFDAEILLSEGATYYVLVKGFNNSECVGTLTIEKHCAEHTPAGDTTCQGTVCAVCGKTYGDAVDHDSLVLDYDNIYHFTNCSMCLEYEDNYYVHEYNEDGVCECGRAVVEGIYFGNLNLKDGQYLDNNGNVSTTQPEGGYAYYVDGTLTFNNFVFAFEGENPTGVTSAIYTESDITIVLKGESSVTMSGGDAIDVYNSDLVVGGEGSIVLRTTWNEGYSGDGIDVVDGSLTINGGTFFIYVSDNGIEVEGVTIINDGIFYIDAEDDGMEIEDTVINNGTFYIDSDEDDGIEAHNLTINGGNFSIEALDEHGIEANGLLEVNDGIFDVVSGESCFYSADGAAFNGGSFLLETYNDIPVIYGYESLTFSDAYGELNVLINDEDQYYLADENDDPMFISYLVENDAKVIYTDCISYNNLVYYNGEPQTPEISVRDYESGELLTLDVDYTITRLTPASKETGVYVLLISGIGSYTGSVIVDYTIHECYDLTLDSDLDLVISGVNDRIYSFVKFTPKVSATYRFVFETSSYLNVGVLEGINDVDYYHDRNGYIVVEIDLIAGVSYYFDVYDEDMDSECHISAEVICNEHRGGTATYHDYAVCEVCGESYGELLECSGHFGGEATYHDRAVCVECGYEYGDLLICDHMCHKGSYYTIIWKIFEKIYIFLGIEEECQCGEEHY